MSRKSFLAILFLLVSLLGPRPLEAQTSLKISREFLKTQFASERELESVCGNLEIKGGTGWLVIELTLSSYISSFQRISASLPGKEILDHVSVDCSPYYLPDLLLQSSRIEMEPKKETEGQPMKYVWKAKLGPNLKPFIMKICRSAIGYWRGQTFNQFAQAIDLKASWVAGDSEPENPSSQSLSGNDWNYGPTTRVGIAQQGSSITINSIVTDHGTSGPHYQITGTIKGNIITGTWRWIGTTVTRPGDKRFTDERCLSGSITAEIASDWRSFRIVAVEDPCGHGWNGIVIRR